MEPAILTDRRAPTGLGRRRRTEPGPGDGDRRSRCTAAHRLVDNSVGKIGGNGQIPAVNPGFRMPGKKLHIKFSNLQRELGVKQVIMAASADSGVLCISFGHLARAFACVKRIRVRCGASGQRAWAFAEGHVRARVSGDRPSGPIVRSGRAMPSRPVRRCQSPDGRARARRPVAGHRAVRG